MKNMKNGLGYDSVEAKPMNPEMSGYPCDLRLTLNNEVLMKLGIKDLPDIGSNVVLSAKALVCESNHNEDLYGENKRLSLQITDLEIAGKVAAEED